MAQKIIADSCCDMTPSLKERLGLISIPLTMKLGEAEYLDDDSLDLKGFMQKMQSCKERVGSASPSPALYQQQFEAADTSYAITLSSKLSGSCESAHLGKHLAAANGREDVHIIDSKSASAGQVLVAVKLRELLDRGLPKEHIIASISSFIEKMKTYFVLENYDNLQKNGRLNKIACKLIKALNIKLVMGSDGNGEIKLFSKARGTGQMITKLLGLIASSGKETEGETLVVSHCNNLCLAEKLRDMAQLRFNFKEILIVPTGGLSSLYADDKGIVMAF